ncbi:DUF3857 domain-containing protein [Aureivirga marina]|uniref:DUF3857 domain-containing protein n=1 Tax=Aureivirga marina TaxID=1182451 RepID=UPI0018CA13F1|nr:DUF3857 domain-containing protein [Aureivirga marina]
MKNKVLLLLFFCILSVCNLKAQEKSIAPKEINATIVNQSEVVNIKKVNSLTYSYYLKVIVHNKSGFESIIDPVYYSDETKIKKLKATILNQNGSEIKKFTKSDFKDYSAVPNGTIYSDDRMKFLDYTPLSYPFTLIFEYEITSSNTSSIPSWIPIRFTKVLIENSSYTLNYNPKLTIQTKEKNFKNYTIEDTSSGNTIKKTLQSGYLKYESEFGKYIRDIIPIMRVNVSPFHVSGYEGSFSNWKEFGKFMSDNLLIDRQEVSDETKNEILKLTSITDNPIEKAKIVYQYVQDNTRYISVQVGIGGMQPIPAKEVDKVKYGDCKGLSNYTQSLLQIVGVPAYYAHVESGNRKIDFDPEFADFRQGNHVILYLPISEEGIWLECTSQTMPFGFLGDFTDDRDVVVMTPEGGKIMHTTSYLNEQNSMLTEATITFDSEGNLNSNVSITTKGTQYDGRFYLESQNKEYIEKFYKKSHWNYLNNISFENISFKNDKEKIEFTESLHVKAKKYLIPIEQNYLFSIDPFSRANYTPSRNKNRKSPIIIQRGYKDISVYTIKLPEGFSIPEAIFEPTEFSCEQGKYFSKLEKISETELKYTREISLNKGEYPKETYKDFRKFF